ncbi:hypothetical protein VaNZ11_015006 [Volvox africanus]|uniref:Protein kinase domain-containing protein n=1 Tax=Volvox africanus TaxID=51714 RepID=A0ABQ5SKQ2_9CHLO|nr:hypothetical protein VaNZ11_015006 [Volvox africanus]
MAGEYLDNRLYKSSDVYSFGVLLWQMYTGKTPFAGHLEAQVAVGVMMGNLQLEWPTTMPPPLLRLGQACCRHEPDQRPTFKEVAVALMGIEAQVRDAHARAKMAMRRVDGSVSSASRPVHGSSGILTLPLAHAMSHPQPHGAGSGVLEGMASGATLTATAARSPHYSSQQLLNQSYQHHQLQQNHTHYQSQQQPVTMQQQQQQQQQQQEEQQQLQGQHHQQQQQHFIAHEVVACRSNTLPNYAASHVIESCCRPSHTQSLLLLGSQKVNMLREACSVEFASELRDSGPGAPPSSFMSNVGADVVGAASMTAAATIPSPPTTRVLQEALAAAPQAPFLQPPQQPQPAVLTQTSQLPPHFSSGRFVPTSTSRLHIRTSFADIPQVSPGGGECGDYGFKVCSVAQHGNSPPPMLSDSLSVHTVMAPRKLQAATGIVTVPSFTCSSVTESPPVPFALSPTSPAGSIAWAACFSPPAAVGTARKSSVVSATLGMGSEISPLQARSLEPVSMVPASIAMAHDARTESDRRSVDFSVDGTKMPVVEFTSVFGEALDSLGEAALLGSTTKAMLAPSGSAAGTALVDTCPLQQLAPDQLKTPQQQPPAPGASLVLAQPIACGLPCRLPQASFNPYGPGATCGCSGVESNEPCTGATTPGISVAAAAALQHQLMPDIQRHASLPVSLLNAGGHGGRQGTSTPLSASMVVPAGCWFSANITRLEDHPPQVVHQPQSQQEEPTAHLSPSSPSAYAVVAAAGGNGDSEGVWAGRMTPSHPGSALLHGLVQQHQPQSAGIARGAFRGGRVAAANLSGVSRASLPAAAPALHRRPRSAFGSASVTGATAGRRGSGAGPMPYLHGSNTVAGFPAAAPHPDDLSSPGFASMMLIPLAPLQESVEGPGTGAEA